MQHEAQSVRQSGAEADAPGVKLAATTVIGRVAVKEVSLFFASPIAYLFLGTFAVVTLFVFFWVEAFFARNIADIRPLFEWMPVLLIFLCAALTMRLWSEERRTGTLEYVHTRAVPLWQFVVGKFVACMLLLLLALAVTLPLPITVARIGDLDWGPVFAGYLATLVMGAAYLSIGLFVSARSDNQIVSLITSVVVCGVLYLLGTPLLTDFFGSAAGEWLRLFGTGSRFESITRGVIDLRDLYYYISIVLVFLTLNTLVLEKERWAQAGDTVRHRQWTVVIGLLVANVLLANFWLGQVNRLRLDVTEGRQYSVSDATRNYLNQLQEPLLLRGYFSSKTHPLLAPLVPQLRDLMREYQVAGRGRVRVEFVDPARDPELEEEANSKYGIEPVPFQVASRYEASIVNSYFDVLVQYGDQYEVLNFRDLIEVKARGEADLDVQLRNPEHDLTRAIKKVLNSYQAGGNLFDTVKGQLRFVAYASAADKLPAQLRAFRDELQPVLERVRDGAGGRFTIEWIDPDADGGAVGQQIAADYGFRPMTAGLFSGRQFYFYLTLTDGEQIVQVPLADLKAASFERNLQAAIKRFASGFTKTVALVTPAPQASFGMPAGANFSRVEEFLGAEMSVRHEDLSDGRVSGDADILVLLAPAELDERQLFAVDQFLMQGGTVIAATSPFSASFANRSLTVEKHTSGLEDWLRHNGLDIKEQLVLDPQNAAFPVPVTRNVGGFQLQEYRMLDYPYFVDVRGDGLQPDHPITAELPQATLAWASPIEVDAEKNAQREVVELLRSSPAAWLSASQDVLPRVTATGVSGFQPEGEQGRQLLGVVSTGRFDSYFAGKPSPLLNTVDGEDDEPAATAGGDAPADDAEDELQLDTVIEKSPESARIVLLASNDFLRDQILQLLGVAAQTEYVNTVQLVANAVDWSLEDAGLLSIRSRGHFNRTLAPLDHSAQLFWEYLNYVLAAIALIAIAVGERRWRASRQQQYMEQYANQEVRS